MNKYKIRILTFHSAASYGAVLQCYALYTYLKNKYYDVKVIDFRPKNFSISINLRKPQSIIKCLIFKIFCLKISFTKKYNEEEIRNNPPDGDIFIIGSDQVWNPYITKDVKDIYYGNFIPKEKIKIAYAASFGLNNFPEDEINNMHKYIHDFKAISIREESGVKFCTEHLGIDSECVIDPVFLLDKNQYLNHDYKTKDILTLFMLDNNSDECFKFARNLASIMNLSPYILNKFKPVSGFKTIKYPTVYRFLKTILQSKFIITNSFHGLAFSILFNKEFIFICTSSDKADRPFNLMKKLNLTERFFFDYESALKSNVIKKHIDYIEVNKKIENLRLHSINFLEKNLM